MAAQGTAAPSTSPADDPVQGLEFDDDGDVKINGKNERRTWPLLCAALHARDPRITKIRWVWFWENLHTKSHTFIPLLQAL